jgi:hypothetical protein
MPIEIKESVIYGGRRQVIVEREGQIHSEIELNATGKSHRIESLEKSVQS